MNQEKHIMLDLETMGKTDNAAITAVGAVYFDLNNILSRFDILVDLNTSTGIGMEMDVDTVLWWSKQSDEARAQLHGRVGQEIADRLDDPATCEERPHDVRVDVHVDVALAAPQFGVL